MARIVHLSKFYPPTPGGLEKVVQIYAEGFAARGHAVTVIACSSDGRASREAHGPNLEVLRFAPDVAALRGQFSLAYLRALRRLAGEADLIHTHEPNPLATLGLLTTPTKAAIHVTWHADVLRQKFAAPVLRPMQAALCRRAKTIQASSANLARSSYMLPRFTDKVAIVPLGLDLAPFAAAAADEAAVARTRAELGDYVFASGRLAGYKGFDYLLDALAGTDIPLVVAGDGPLRGALEAQAARLGLGSRAKFLGRVTDARMAALCAACVVYAFPSCNNSEAFGLAQVEAMACGRPVVNASLETGVPEVSLDGETGLTVPPRDVAALRAAIERLWRDRALAERFGAAARARAFARFERAQVVARLAEVYGLD